MAGLYIEQLNWEYSFEGSGLIYTKNKASTSNWIQSSSI